jgi:ATP-dependent DNA helicase DinG
MRQELVINERREFYERTLGNEFSDYYLAHRTRALHQKLGRLLRTENDFGGVIVVDSRTKSWKGKTMERFLRMMEPYRMQKTSLEEACTRVASFIDQQGKS